MPQFVHLHNHTEFSLLDGAAKIKDMIAKAKVCEMPAVAITDHGNMYGVPKFVLECKYNDIKAIIGCEFYIVKNNAKDRIKGTKRYHQIIWAKNKAGYHNLVKLCSYGYTDGYYYKPRIDRETLKKHTEGLIASTCCLASEVNRALIDEGEQQAEAILKEYLAMFAPGDYYVEIQRHNLRDMEKCNAFLLRMAKKHGLKVIATNDVHYVNKEDSEAHDLLLALQTNSDYSDPNRFRFTDDHNRLNPCFYFKTKDEMAELFKDVPESLENTMEIVDKCQFELKTTRDMILPQYDVPTKYRNMDEYLEAMVWERLPSRFNEATTEIRERIEEELKIIRQKGYAGYFLIVQDFTTEARKRGVYVGPGRGSAAGSLVSYILGIIDIDPLHYDLLFERFLNPDRISPPDIDIDFDDEGRQEVIDYVIEKYGRKSVSQVITYGTMGAKTAIRDVGRTLKIPLAEVNRIAKLIPDKPGISFKKALNPEKNPDTYEELKQLFESTDPQIKKMMRFAKTLEGTARHTGVHACAVIIAPEAVSNIAPLARAKDGAIITQYDGPHAELVGLLKMDFLGLKTLSIIKTAVKLVKENRGIVVDPDEISLEDPKTYELYQRGDTIGTFQFESDGMRKYLRQLRPTDIEDLIAMNALYRPGPMDNIPLFVDRKHGRAPLEYPHPMLESILKNTQGIMVYQEQIMQVAQKMGGYSLGQADLLRRAMGKKKMKVMAKERVNFVAGAKERKVPEKTANEVYDLMEKFASYGFNKSHAAAYSVLAFKTAYMKAHYLPEYMAAVLTHNVNDIKKITFFIEESRRLDVQVLPPDINESRSLFAVNKKGEIRFGLEAIKGVGKGVVEKIIEEREKAGPFKDLFDLTTRMPPRTINKKVLESLSYAGAFDTFQIERYRYFLQANQKDEASLLEKSIQYGNKVYKEKHSPQVSLFGSFGGNGGYTTTPTIPVDKEKEWTKFQKLNFEKEVIGFYLSGHPLDRYKWQIDNFTTCPIAKLDNYCNRRVQVAGIVTKHQIRTTRKGKKFLAFTLEDFTSSIDLVLFNDDFIKFSPIVTPDEMLYIYGEYLPSWRDDSVFELKIRDIKLIDEELFEKMVKKLRIHIESHNLNEKLIKQIQDLCETYKGECLLDFTIIDRQIPTSVTLHSTNTLIKPCKELTAELETLGLEYSFN